MLLLLANFSLFACTVAGELNLTSVVQTDSGPVRGLILTTVLEKVQYAAFKGIPYAEPPVGYLRFRPPVAKKSWSGVINTTKEGSSCPQYDSISDSAVGSENCLYINIYTPHTTFDVSMKKTVMFFIFGGGFTTGSSDQNAYGPDFLIEEDVIMVSFNYRVNAFGFLNLNHENATGNAGLKDQNLALKWINKNIAYFGGDPKKITIFGQSAGSVSVDLQILSDMSTGLFQRSISMSGSTLCFFWGFQTIVEATDAAFTLGSKLGIDTEDKDELLRTLYNTSVDDIVLGTNNVGVLPFRPTVESTHIAKDEEKFLTSCSVEKYLIGNYTRVPSIMGFTKNEMVSFGGNIAGLFALVEAALESLNNESITVNLPIISNISTTVKNGDLNITETLLYEFIKEASDLFFYVGIDTKQQLLSVHNKYPIYYYRFSFDSNYSLHKAYGVDLEGVGHGDDLPYIFYIPAAGLPLNDPDIAITRKRIIRMWTNFAKYGNPVPKGEKDELIGVEWTSSGIYGKCLEIDRNITIEPRPTDTSIRSLQLAGLGASPILNDCSYGVFSDVINNIVGILGLLG